MRAVGEIDRLALERGKDGDPRVLVRWHIDDFNTHSDELDAYHRFLEQLGGRDFVAPDFVARDWEVTGAPDGLWGRMQATAELHLREEALEALCAVDEDAVYETLRSELDIAPSSLGRVRRGLAAPSAKVRRRARTLLPGRAQRILTRAHATLTTLRRACAEEDPERRLSGMVKALYGAHSSTGKAFDAAVPAALLTAIDKEALAKKGDLLLEGRIYKFVENAPNLPERRDLVGRVGKKKRRVKLRDYRLFPFDTYEQWAALDWLHDAEDAPAHE